MNTSFQFAGVALVLCAVFAAEAAPSDADKAAGDACESSVADTVRRMRGRDAQEVQFVGAQRALSPLPDDEVGVKGEGRYRGSASGSVAFTYSCTFNAKTRSTTGVVMKDKGGARAGSDDAWQPDLTNLSPEACEAATAVALKRKHPRVDRIAFDPNSRKLRPAPNAHTSLEGQGGMVRAPGMNSIPFTYQCEFEARSGKVVGVKTSD